jgi:hypothetical protein
MNEGWSGWPETASRLFSTQQRGERQNVSGQMPSFDLTLLNPNRYA